MISFFIDRWATRIPKVIVRGIQLGIGLKLALKGLSWIKGLPILGMDSLLMMSVLFVFLWIGYRLKIPMILFVFMFGIFLVHHQFPHYANRIQFSLPSMEVVIPSMAFWGEGFIKGTLVQIPLSLLNSVVAVCALSSSYFPNQGIKPRKMALSVGIMNLISVPLGGIPVCHGSGGLAAQYRFGARTGASVMMIGVIKIVIGLLFGSVLLSYLKAYPLSIIGLMLIFSGWELAKIVKDVLDSKKNIIILAMMTLCIILINTFIGFLFGCLSYFIFYLLQKYNFIQGKGANNEFI